MLKVYIQETTSSTKNIRYIKANEKLLTPQQKLYTCVHCERIEKVSF